MVGELLDDRPALASGELAADAELVRDRGVALIVRGIPRVDRNLHCTVTSGRSCRLRRQLSREQLACGLSSERANERSKRFIATISRRTRPPTSRSPIALLSRSDHNAATPSRMNRCVPHECDGQPGGHHVIAEHRRSRGSVKPASPVRGRSEAEWLDRAADRRTISRRDGRGARDLGARQRTRKAIEARWWKKGRRRRSTAAAVRIQSECALTYMNASSGENLSAARTVQVNAGAQGVRNSAAHSTVSRTRAVPPDERDMHLGRERPPWTEARDRDRGVAEGVAHAPDASSAAA